MPGRAERLLITDAVVVTMNDANDVHFGGAIAIEGDRIAAVGPSADVVARFGEGARILDAHGGAVMPGLVDLHYHTAIGRGWSDHLPLWQILQESGTRWFGRSTPRPSTGQLLPVTPNRSGAA
jgi:5-methylthioadenosine/S-adenosylhomocysteine deaminase